MRIFVAIDLPEEIRSRLGELQEHWSSGVRSARWVAAETIHVTLKFIGEATVSRVSKIDQALSGVLWRPFPVTVGGLGFFPGARSARVLWAGLDAPSLEGLAKEIDARLESIGIGRETRDFRAHVTLARANETRFDQALVQAVIATGNPTFGSFTADRFFLYESVLKPTGSVYTRVKEYRLS